MAWGEGGGGGGGEMENAGKDQGPLGGGYGDGIRRAKWQFMISERWEIINTAWIKPKRKKGISPQV